MSAPWNITGVARWAVLAGSSVICFGQSTNLPVTLALPDTGTSAALSLIRVLGALGLVFAVFFGGLWAYRNWEKFAVTKGRAARLSVCEAKSLGQRHTLYVIGYENQRMLIASSPNGISLLTSLPSAEPEALVSVPERPAVEIPCFSGLLTQLLARKP